MAESLELKFRVESAAVAVLLAAMLVQTSLVAVLLPILVRRTDYQLCIMLGHCVKVLNACQI